MNKECKYYTNGCEVLDDKLCDKECPYADYEPQPEGANAPELLPAVSGCDESWKLLHRQIVDIYSHTCKIEFPTPFAVYSKLPVSIEYEVKDSLVIDWASNYLIEDGDGYLQQVSVLKDEKIKIKLQFKENSNWCVEEIYFHHGR